MSTVRKLSPEEIQRLRARGNRVDLTPYEESLKSLQVGDWGLIQLEPGEKTTTIKRRHTAAAKNQGKRLIYKRLRNGTLPFEVRELSS